MKKFLVAITTVFMSSQLALAESKTAEVNLSGAFNQDKEKVEDETSTDNIIGVMGSYLFIFDSIGVGPTLTYTNYQSKSDDSSYHSWNAGLGVKAKYYFANVQSEKVVPYATLAAVLNQGTSEDTKSSGNEVSVGAGMHYSLNNFVAFTPELNYAVSQSTTKYEDDALDNRKVKSNSMGLMFGITAFL